MNKFFPLCCLLACLVVNGPVLAETASDPASTMPVTVVIEVTVTDSAKLTQASATIHKLRDLLKQYPALLEETMLENINPDNSPSFAHVTRWTSFKDWESIYLSPEFNELAAAGRDVYTIRAVAFKSVK